MESEQSAEGRQPQHTHVVLADVGHGNGFALRIVGIDVAGSKCLGQGIEFIQELTASDPQRAGTVFEQRGNENSARTVGAPGPALNDLEMLPAVALAPKRWPK